ncbi:four helix bundle protein [Flaviaesturariibacter aridisoli]|uniref:Four helix bundle protein n=1 Tax=Flaviaesturariibacter aridisoli TaxID=2545761 RepID=A0A4V2WMN3_9BACT|nr:four helix bundle protein [Flaviaesturariibacter aridisoli]
MYYQKLEERLIEFASNIIGIAERLPRHVAGRYYADQVSRSGSSPALHYGEAQSAESPADFAHKMKVGLKELRETFVALRIIRLRRWLSEEELQPMLQENNELISIFVTCIFPR